MKKTILTLALAALFLTSCGDDPPPKTIKQISLVITKVVESKDSIRIFIEPGSALRAKDHFQNISMSTYTISQGLVKYFPKQMAGDVVYVASVDSVDGYGNNSTEPALELKYKVDDLKKVNFDNIYHRDLLELSEPVKYLNMAGRQVINTWCIEEENKTVAINFCAKNT